MLRLISSFHSWTHSGFSPSVQKHLKCIKNKPCWAFLNCKEEMRKTKENTQYWKYQLSLLLRTVKYYTNAWSLRWCNTSRQGSEKTADSICIDEFSTKNFIQKIRLFSLLVLLVLNVTLNTVAVITKKMNMTKIHDNSYRWKKVLCEEIPLTENSYFQI